MTDKRIDVRTLGWNLVSKAKYLRIASGSDSRGVHVGVGENHKGVHVGIADYGSVLTSTGSYTTSQKTVIERVVQDRMKIARERLREALGRHYKPGMHLSPAKKRAFRSAIADSIDRVDLLDIGESGGEKGYLIVDGHHTLAAYQRLKLPVRALIYAPWRQALGERLILRAPTDERF